MGADRKVSQLFRCIVAFCDTSVILSHFTAEELDLPVEISRHKLLSETLCQHYPAQILPKRMKRETTTWLMLAVHFGNFQAAIELVAHGAAVKRDDALHRRLWHVAICGAFTHHNAFSDEAQQRFDDLRSFVTLHEESASECFQTDADQLTLHPDAMRNLRDMICSVPHDTLGPFVSAMQSFCSLLVTMYNCKYPISYELCKSELLDIFKWFQQSATEHDTMPQRFDVFEWLNRDQSFFKQRITDTCIALLPLELPALVLSHILQFIVADLLQFELEFLQNYYSVGIVSIRHTIVTEKPLLESLVPWNRLYMFVAKAQRSYQLWALRMAEKM